MVLLDDLDRRQERRNRDTENSARLAFSYSSFETTGQGTYQHNGRVAFDLTFIEKPMVAYGASVDIEGLADLEDVDSDDVILPNCSGYVTEWDQDERDFYVGCWIAVRVTFDAIIVGGVPAMVVEASPTIEHNFTFSAIAMKDIPPNADDATE